MEAGLGNKVRIAFYICFFIWINLTLECSAFDRMNFRNITIEEGLSQATVETMLQDENGYIWIGTNDGLNCYNGYKFKVYRQQKKNENSIVNNYIVDLEEDDKGNIWVGTINGVSKINHSTGTITNYLQDKNEGNLSHYNIGDMIILKNGEILIGTIGGLDIYNESTDSFEPFIEKGKLTSEEIYSLDEDDNGDIWLGTTKGLNKISYETKEVVQYVSDGTEDSIPDDIIYKVYCDKNDVVWIGTYSNGAAKVNMKTKEVTHYNKETWGFEEKPGEHIRNFYRDSNDTLWISSSGGLIKYNDSKDKMELYKHKTYDKRSLVDDSIFTVIEDKGGMLWVGTYAGISVFDPTNSIKHYKNDPFDKTTINQNMVQGIYEDDEGYLWVGTNANGVNILDKERNNIATVNVDNSLNLSSNRINDIVGYKDLIFLGTNNGLNIIDKSNGTLKVYKEAEGLVSKNIKNLFLDDKNNLWIGTMDGFCILNVDTNEIIDINYALGDINVDDRYSGAIFQDSEGYYWLGSFVNGGLTKINPFTREVTNYIYDENNSSSIIDNSIRCIAEDKEGRIWIGTSGGLSVYNKEINKFANFTTEHGLANNTIYGILFDDSGQPWLSTNGGISTYNLEDHKFINFNIVDGLQSNEFNGEAYLKAKDGELFFGGINGMNSFYPQDLKVSEHITNVVFEDFTVNGMRVENINGKKFRHDENNIKMNVFLPDYKNIRGIRYYYLLEGADSEWRLADSTSILFSNLSSGKYNLRVRAVNSKGFVSDESNVNFEIKRPIWLSWPASFSYIVMIALIIIHQKNKVKKLDALVDRRTDELRAEMNKNKKLFEKVIKLERNKNSYFINLSHELRTPLNVLHTTEQLITTLNRDNNLEKSKLEHYLSIIRRNNTRLLTLINNLIDISKLDHGKYTINKKKVDIVYLVEEVALSLKEYVEDKGIELIIDPEVEEKNISCDQQDIERCIINLISNATKFTPIGGSITVLLQDLDDKVRIIIRDTGIGIAEEYQELIFNRFNQVVDINAEVKGGSGLGLTITKQIIDLHNGSIKVKSKVGEGSSFIIELPVE